MLLLFLSSPEEESYWDEFAFVLYTELVAPLDEEDEALKCMYLRWVTFGSGEKGDDVERERKGREQVAVGKSLGVIPFQSIVSTLHIARVSTALQLSMTEVLWSSHQLYINRIFRECKVVNDQA